jgi:hypothetical protein
MCNLRELNQIFYSSVEKVGVAFLGGNRRRIFYFDEFLSIKIKTNLL